MLLVHARQHISHADVWGDEGKWRQEHHGMRDQDHQDMRQEYYVVSHYYTFAALGLRSWVVPVVGVHHKVRVGASLRLLGDSSNMLYLRAVIICVSRLYVLLLLLQMLIIILLLLLIPLLLLLLLLLPATNTTSYHYYY